MQIMRHLLCIQPFKNKKKYLYILKIRSRLKLKLRLELYYLTKLL